MPARFLQQIALCYINGHLVKIQSQCWINKDG